MDCFELLLVSSVIYFLEVSAGVLLRVVINGLFRRKKSSKRSMFDVVVKHKRKSAIKQFLFFGWFWKVHNLSKYIFSGSECTHFIESTINAFLETKNLRNSTFEAIILKQKQRSATEAIYVFVILLEFIYIPQLYFFRKKCAHVKYSDTCLV